MSQSTSAQSLALESVRIMHTKSVHFPETPPEDASAPVSFTPYRRPADTMKLSDCVDADAFNLTAWVSNMRGAPMTRTLLSNMSLIPGEVLRPPPPYVANLQNHIVQKMNELPAFELLVSLVYLREVAGGQLPWTSYDPADAVRLAREHAMKQAIAEQLAQHTVFTIPAADAHRMQCPCAGTWDGRSALCRGNTAAVEWYALDDHRCVRPRVSCRLRK